MKNCDTCYWRAVSNYCMLNGKIKDDCTNYLAKITTNFPQRDITIKRMLQGTANAPKCPMCCEVHWAVQEFATLVCTNCGFLAKFNMQIVLETHRKVYNADPDKRD